MLQAFQAWQKNLWDRFPGTGVIGQGVVLSTDNTLHFAFCIRVEGKVQRPIKVWNDFSQKKTCPNCEGQDMRALHDGARVVRNVQAAIRKMLQVNSQSTAKEVAAANLVCRVALNELEDTEYYLDGWASNTIPMLPGVHENLVNALRVHAVKADSSTLLIEDWEETDLVSFTASTTKLALLYRDVSGKTIPSITRGRVGRWDETVIMHAPRTIAKKYVQVPSIGMVPLPGVQSPMFWRTVEAFCKDGLYLYEAIKTASALN